MKFYARTSPRVCVSPPRARFLSSSSSKRDDVTTKKATRRRHQFGNIPSFRDFQQILQAKALYRKFMRISKHDDELRTSIRREFRNNHHPSDLQRALSEGNRRFKELSAMMGTLSHIKQQQVPASSSVWPWNHRHRDNDIITVPIRFPPKNKKEL